MSVTVLMMSPESKGLFKRAIMQSGSYMYSKKRPILPTSQALESSKQLASKVDCDPQDQDWLSCLRSADPKDLIENYDEKFLPIVEGTDIWPVSAQKAFDKKEYNKGLHAFTVGLAFSLNCQGFSQLKKGEEGHLSADSFMMALVAVPVFKFGNGVAYGFRDS